MTMTVPELVPESSFFPAGKFSRSNRTRSRRKECFISKSVRCCTHIVQKLYISACISCGEIERIECRLFFVFFVFLAQQNGQPHPISREYFHFWRVDTVMQGAYNS